MGFITRCPVLASGSTAPVFLDSTAVADVNRARLFFFSSVLCFGNLSAYAVRTLTPIVKILFVHAHFDDFEFTAAGTFEIFRQHRSDGLRRRVLICTDGKAGHHFRTREETQDMRLAEQTNSARIGGYEFEMLKLPNGQVPREACLLVTTELLAALWKSIREFEPDYLFCPPVPADPLAGIHVDHVAVAEAVRNVAYMINVPHAFTPEYSADERHSRPCKVPAILNVYDAYSAGTNSHDLAVDVEAAFDRICEMSWCHQSQIAEWLPWVGRHKMAPPSSKEDWTRILRERFQRKNRDLGLATERALEVFTVTAWGTVPTYEQLLEDIPNIVLAASNLERMKQRLAKYNV